MFDKLENVVNRYEQIGIELTRPDVASNNELFRKLMKEHSELTPIVEKYKEYQSAKTAEKDALEILSEPNLDKDFKELAEEELNPQKKISKFSLMSLKFFFYPKTPTTTRMLLSKSAAVQVAKKRHFLQALYTVCTQCMPSLTVGR